MSWGTYGIGQSGRILGVFTLFTFASSCSARLDWSNFLNGIQPPTSSITLSSPASTPGNNSMPVFSIANVTVGDTVELFSDVSCITLVTSSVVASGTVIALGVPSPVSEGPVHTFYYKKTSATLVTTGCSTDFVSYVYDSSPPSLSIASPTAASSRQATFTLSGSCESGLSVNVSGSHSFSPSVISCNLGNFNQSVTASGAEGPMTLTVSQTDLAGNVANQTVSFTKDTIAPSLAFTSPAIGSYRNASVFTVLGNCEGSGSISFSGDLATGAGAALCSSGTFSQNVSLSTGDGPKTVSVSQSDLAGNSSTVSLNLNLDTQAPLLAVGSPTDGITVGNSATVSGTCESGVSVILAGTSLPTPGSTACVGGNFSQSVTFSAGDGARTLTISQTDAASNASNMTRNLVLDTTPPSAPTSLSLINPTVSPSAVNQPLIQINGVISGDTVTLYSGPGCNNSVGSAVAAGPSIQIQSSVLTAGSYSFFAKSTDPIGNIGACSSTGLNYTYDSSVLTISQIQITNSSPTNSTTYNLNWGSTITGTATHYCILENDTTMANCAWLALPLPASYTVNSTNNAKVLSAWIWNGGGTYSARADSNSVSFDNVLPPTPVAAGLISPAASPNRINNTPTVRFSNTVSGDTISIYSDSACSSPAFKGSMLSSGTNTDITSTVIPESTINYYAKATDPAGNESACSSSSVTYRYDISAPEFTAIAITTTGPTNLSPWAISISGIPTAPNEPSHYCINENDTDVGNCIWNIGAPPGTIGVNTAISGAKTFHAWLMDSAGNVSGMKTSNTVIFDNIAPTFSWGSLQTIDGGSTSVSLTWSASDLDSGLNNSATITFAPDGVSFGSPQIINPTLNAATYNATTMPDDNLPNAKFRITVYDLANNSTTVDLSTRILSVRPRYPVAPHWLSYYRFPATTNACSGSEVGRNACKHGGDRRMILAGAATDCTGITADDSLGVFDWTCEMLSGFPYVHSRLKGGKNLSDLLNPTAFKLNQVTVRQSGTPIFTSSLRTWWQNTIKPEVPSAGIKTLSLSGGDINPIWVINSTGDTDGYNLNSDGIGLVVLPPNTLRLSTSGPANVNTSNGESTSADNWNIVSAGSQKFIWVEGNLNGIAPTNSPFGGIFFHSVKFSTIRGPSIVNTGNTLSPGIYLFGSTNNIEVANIRLAFNARGLIVSDGVSYSTFRNMIISNCIEASVFMGASVQNVFQNILLHNNPHYGIYDTSSDGTIFTQMTFAANSGSTTGVNQIRFIKVNNSVFSKNIILHNTLIASSGPTSGASTTSVIGMGDSSGPNITQNITLSQMAIGNVVGAIDEWNTLSNRITGTFVLGNHHYSFPCYSATGASTSSSCANAGQSNATLVTAASTIESAFSGLVTTNDSANTSDTNGVVSHAALSDYFRFEHFYRSWGLQGSPWAQINHPNRMPCTGATCQIIDFSLSNSGSAVLNRSNTGSSLNSSFVPGASCPSEINGNAVLTTDLENGNRPYLKNAVELVGAGFTDGNEDGLCESNEMCLYTPNFGAYQGHGAANGCIFSNGTITGVKMLGYDTNGR